jgi:hypothetical protein
VQTIRTDQQIAFDRAAVLELDPHAIARTDRLDYTGITVDAVGRKAFEQTVEQNPTGDHPNGSAQAVHDRGDVDIDQLTTGRRRNPHGGQQLTRSLHIDAKLIQDRRAVGPDGHRTATGPHIRSPFEDGHIMSVSE